MFFKKLTAITLSLLILITLSGCNTEKQLTDISEYTPAMFEINGEILKNDVLKLAKAINCDAENIITFSADYNKSKLTNQKIVIATKNEIKDTDLDDDLSVFDYKILQNNDNFYILGGSEDATVKAVRYFTNNMLSNGYAENSNYHYTYNYPVKSVKIGKNDLFDYSIIISENADRFTKSAAENFNRSLEALTGKTLKIITDNVNYNGLKIVLGKTKLTDTAALQKIENNQYFLYINHDTIYADGNDYMVGAGLSHLITRINESGKKAVIKNLPSSQIPLNFEFKSAKNAILMIGDGMGYNTIKMALPQIKTFNAQSLPFRGSSVTKSQTTIESNGEIPTDSAAGGTALSTGQKTYNAYLGIDKDKNKLENIREIAARNGYKTAVLTTDIITGATPSAFLVHCENRDFTTRIKKQIADLVNEDKIDYCLGNASDFLTSKTADYLTGLSADNSNYFMMIEEGQIDKRSHKNDMNGCISMVDRFDNAICYVAEFVIFHPDTVLIVTADHETGGITEELDGSFNYTTGGHSNVNVPIFSLGRGTEFFAEKTVENTEISNFIFDIINR